MDENSILQYENIDEGICERLADINTRTQAMKSLTTLAEAATPGFISERMSKILNEHKNPKVLIGAMLWMVSAVEDYGVSHLKNKDVLIDFCIYAGLDSSDAATTSAARKLLGALHEFVRPEFQTLAIYCTLEAECEFQESKQLEKMSLDDPQDENLDDEGTKLEDLLETSLDSLFDCSKEEIFRHDMEMMQRWKEIEASDQCTRCGIPIWLCTCEPIFDFPILKTEDASLLDVDTLWTPYESFKSWGPYACTCPSIVLKE